MAKAKCVSPEINYLYAHLILDSEYEAINPGWSEALRREGMVIDNGSTGHVSLVAGDFPIEFYGVTLPLTFDLGICRERSVMQSAKRIIGDFGDNLRRYAELSKKGILQDNLYFTPRGLGDYSRSERLDGRKVSEWVAQAKGALDNLAGYFPNNFTLPRNSSIEFVPTFQALRDASGLLERMDEGEIGISGNTFSDRVTNFLAMYDAVTAHINWTEKESLKEYIARQKGEVYDGHKIARVVIGEEALAR